MRDSQITAKAKAEAYEHAANRAMELAGDLRHCVDNFKKDGWGFNIEMARNILYDGLMALIPRPASAGEPQIPESQCLHGYVHGDCPHCTYGEPQPQAPEERNS